MNEYVADCWVTLDGENKPFLAYMDFDQASIIQELGLENIDSVCFKETDDRPIPESLTQGLSEIKDILVRLQPNICFFLN